MQQFDEKTEQKFPVKDILKMYLNSIRLLIFFCILIIAVGIYKSYLHNNITIMVETLAVFGLITICFIIYWITWPHRVKKIGEVKVDIKEFDDIYIIRLDTSQLPNNDYDEPCPIYKFRNRP